VLTAGGIKVIGVVVSFLFLVVVARILSVEEFGIFASCFSAAMLLSSICGLGQQASVIRFWPAMESKYGKNVAVHVILHSFLLIVGSVSFLIVIGIAISVADIDLPTLDDKHALLLPLLGLTAALALSEVLIGSLRSQGYVASAFLPRDVFWRLLAGIILAALPIVWSASHVIWMTVVILFMLLGFQALWLVLKTPALRSYSNKLPLPDTEIVAIKRALPGFWGNSIFTQLQQQSSVLIVAITLSPSDAGIFFAASRIANFLTMPQIASNQIVAPILSRSWSASRIQDLSLVLGRAIAYSLPIALLGFFVLLLFGEKLLSVFSSDFSKGYHILIILSVSYVVANACGPNGLLLLMTGFEKQLLKLKVLISLFGASFSIVLALQFGLVGVAFGAFTTVVLQNVVGLMACKYFVGVTPKLPLKWGEDDKI
jgi:O-antigen/teichoic acid export membrane protein